MRMPLRVAGTLAALCCAGSLALAASSLGPPPVGYRPALDSDEGGLWALMEKEEATLKVSPALVKDEALNAYIKNLVCELAEDQCAAFRVYIVDNPNSNALTAPNGMIIVWTGLLLRVQNEAELAFVLGHEITHYLRRHSLLNFQRVSNTAGSIAFLAAATGGIGALLAFPAIGGLAAYSREQEREADDGGYNLAIGRHYDPNQGALFMANTSEEEDANPNRSKPSAYFASHPATKERLATLLKRIGEIGDRSQIGNIGAEPFRAATHPHRMAWLDGELNRGSYAQSVVMIKQLLRAETDSGELHYALGEALRRRNTVGDSETAMAAYRAAIDTKSAPIAAFRGLGLVALKLGDNNAAREAFQQYLMELPDARDRATVEYYLTTLGGKP